MKSNTLRRLSDQWTDFFQTLFHTSFTKITIKNAALVVFFVACFWLSSDVLASSFDDAKSTTAAGQNHTVYLQSDGTLWAFGKNDRGQLGDGTTIDRRSPVQIGTDNDWVSVTAGAEHTLALKTNGTIWAWGDNEFFQTGHQIAMYLTEPWKVAIRPDSPFTINNDWVSIDAGDYHNVALRSDGSLWVWGSNDFGQLGLADVAVRGTPSRLGFDNDWISAAAGAFHTLGLKVNGTVFAWGSNYWGQLGDGSTTQRSTPVQVLIPGGGGLFDNDWVAVDAGGFHSLALKSNGTLWAWGENLSGQLGTFATDSCFIGSDCQKSPRRLGSTPSGPGTENSWSHFAAGYTHSVALKSDGSLWAWGRNDVGQVGDDNVPIQRNVPELISADSDWSSVAAGGSHTIARRANGAVMAWGSNLDGQLGDGTTATQRDVPTQIGEDSNRWTAVSSDGSYTLAVRSDGSLWGWGDNIYGQLGDGTTVDKDFPVRIGTDRNWVAVATARTHAIALKTNGSIYGWGRNAFGQLGDGTNSDKTVPVRIGSDNDWQEIAVGSGHTIALKSDGTLWAWGWNIVGQLGDGSTSDRYYPDQIGLDSDWVSISARNGHNLALKSDGSLWGWGDNDLGSLGTGSLDWALSPVRIGAENNWAAVSTGAEHTLALKANGEIWAWGSNYAGQLGRGTTSTYSADPGQVGTDDDWVFILAGDGTSTAIKSNGTRWAWGTNGRGQLGDGTTTNQSIPVQIGADHDWVFLEAGGIHTVALRADGTMWFSGRNRDGQFGTGNTDDSLVPARGGLLTVADAGSDHFVSFNDSVNLNGSNSQTVVPGGLHYSWICLQGCGDLCLIREQYVGPIPFAERVIKDIPEIPDIPSPRWPGDGVSIEFEAPSRAGSMILQLHVTDSYGESDTDEVAVTIFEDADHAVFVSPAGDNSFTGTMANPLADIIPAVDRANSFRQCEDTGATCSSDSECSGRCIPADIYVQEGDYTATDTVNIRNHMSVYGGFAYDWTRTSEIPTRILGAETALSVSGVTSPTIVDGLHIRSQDGVSPSTYDFAENSIALYVVASTADLEIRNNILEAGFGSAGGPAPEYDQRVTSGELGGDGDDGLPGPLAVVFPTDGGRGGRGGSAGWFGGDGGGCGYDCAFVPFGCAADDGEAGQGGFFGGRGGEACNDDGESGRNGTAGIGGVGAPAEGRIVYTGKYDWLGLYGEPGGGGNYGGGGGGGGAGDGSVFYTYWPFPVPSGTFSGGGGGGGGQGGLGGDGGSPGLSGGASFSIFVANARPFMLHNQLATVGGGPGSKGADGQLGGLGGPGGFGGSGIPLQSDPGGDGGSGGIGGQGGGGGGGGGGPSFGVYEAAEATSNLVANCYSPNYCTSPIANLGIGPGGAGGAGGLPNGQVGQDGIGADGTQDGPFMCTDPIPPPGLPHPGGEDPPVFDFDPPCSTADCDLLASIDWGGSDLAMSLESPSGRIIDRNTIAADVIRDIGPTYERYTIIRAEQGTWRISVIGLDVPPEGERAALSITRKPVNSAPIARCKDVTIAAGSQCKADASINDGSVDPDLNDALSVVQSPLGPFELGETATSLTVVDGDGLSDSCDAVVTVMDETAPQVSCPADVSVPAGASCLANVIPLDAIATDACDSSVSISSDAPIAFPIGTSIVTFTATDDSGVASFCQTKVEVTDVTPPDITCPADVFLSAPATSSMIGSASASDTCSVTPVTTNNAPDQLPLGESLVAWYALDASGNSASCQQTVTVGDTTPPVVIPPPDVVQDATAVLTIVDIGQATASDAFGVSSLTHDAPDEGFPVGVTVVTWTAVDTSGNIGVAMQVVTLTNDPPVLAPILDTAINEGDTLMIAASFVDEDSDSWTATVNYGDGSSVQTLTLDAPTMTLPLNHLYVDNGSYTVTVSITDVEGAFASTDFVVTVNNVAPILDNFIVAPTLAEVGAQAVSASVDFTDPGVLDTHTAIIDWGDGSTTAASVTEANGTGTASGDHVYLATGVYTVAITVTDNDGGASSDLFQFVVIYDPSGGFVTGGGWINSPLGACQLSTACSTLTGKANFGFVSKYKKGATTPTGNTEFQFKAGDLNFHSASYDWLVIAGHKAKYKGVGTINGTGNYGFMLSAIDANLTPSTDVDLFRIKIWDKDNADVVVYDNLMAAAEDADPATEIGGGSIVIHKAKK